MDTIREALKNLLKRAAVIAGWAVLIIIALSYQNVGVFIAAGLAGWWLLRVWKGIGETPHARPRPQVDPHARGVRDQDLRHYVRDPRGGRVRVSDHQADDATAEFQRVDQRAGGMHYDARQTGTAMVRDTGVWWFHIDARVRLHDGSQTMIARNVSIPASELTSYWQRLLEAELVKELRVAQVKIVHSFQTDDQYNEAMV